FWHRRIRVDASLLLRGIVLGLSVAAPVGPIGLLCIKRTLTAGRLTGFVSGLGAATADLLYGSVAAFGLTAVTHLLTANLLWLRLVGGLFLLYLGVQTFRSTPADRAAAASGQGLLGSYASTFALTITNPLTILSFAGMFAALGVGAAAASYGEGMLVATGVFLGSALWWLVLSGTASMLRDRLHERWLGLINRASGLMIIVFGLLALASVAAG
ncbi:MAG TPA: LysE family transporter, partial [Roseiflexaceae bacterium]|nr:LysE family transporter [Roseiflexaceae bacterium]